MNFKEYFLLKENPDMILKRFGDDPNLTRIKYNTNKESYTIIMFENNGKFFYVIRKDVPRTEPGHFKLRMDLLDSGEEPELLSDVQTEIPAKHLPTLAARQKGFEARIWTENKIMSFYNPWVPQMVPTMHRIMKVLRQDPKQYLFEMDGATYNRNSPKNIGVMTYDEFVAGTIDNSAEAQKAANDAKELRGLQSKVRAGFIKDDRIAKSIALLKQQQDAKI